MFCVHINFFTFFFFFLSWRVSKVLLYRRLFVFFFWQKWTSEGWQRMLDSDAPTPVPTAYRSFRRNPTQSCLWFFSSSNVITARRVTKMYVRYQLQLRTFTVNRNIIKLIELLKWVSWLWYCFRVFSGNFTVSLAFSLVDSLSLSLSLSKHVITAQSKTAKQPETTRQLRRH